MPEAPCKRCAIYTRKSTEEGLDQDFNSLDAQREACAAFILSQAGEGWELVEEHYDDGGWSGGKMERPALQQILADIEAGKVDIIVVYKVDRLTRSLADFAKIVEILDDNEASFVSVTQAFNTTNSMGRLTLNVLLSFAQFEREVTSERIRDKIAASKKKGMWMGGAVPHGFRVEDRKLLENEEEAEEVRYIFNRYLQLRSIPALVDDLANKGLRTRRRKLKSERTIGGVCFGQGPLALLLKNPIYIGKIKHKDKIYEGEHEGLIEAEVFERVQSAIATNNRQKLTGYNCKMPSLLSGMLIDPDGRPMSPTRGQRGSKIYCYYVTRLTNGEKKRDPWRVPAGDVDQLVIDHVIRRIGRKDGSDTKRREEWMSNRDQMQSFLRKLEGGPTAEKRESLIDLNCKVQLNRDNIQITLNPPSTGTEIKIEQSAEIVRRGNELKLIDRSGANTKGADADPVLVRLVAQGFAAQKHLLHGDEQPLVKDLSKRHLTRLARLSLLAPDIIQTIMDGHQPKSLTGRQLLRRGDIPLCWEMQRKLLGFSAI